MGSSQHKYVMYQHSSNNHYNATCRGINRIIQQSLTHPSTCVVGGATIFMQWFINWDDDRCCCQTCITLVDHKRRLWIDCIMMHTCCYAKKLIVKWRQIALAKVVLNVQREPYDIDSGCVRNTRWRIIGWACTQRHVLSFDFLGLADSHCQAGLDFNMILVVSWDNEGTSLLMKRMTLPIIAIEPLSPRSVFFVPLSTISSTSLNPTLTLVPPMCSSPNPVCFHHSLLSILMIRFVYVEAQMLLIPPLIMHVGEYWGKQLNLWLVHDDLLQLDTLLPSRRGLFKIPIHTPIVCRE